MNGFSEIFLIVGIIATAMFSMWTSHEAIQAMNEMNKQIQVMFVKS